LDWPTEGKVILDGDNKQTKSLWQDFRSQASTYGLNEKCSVYASHPEMIMEEGLPQGMRFRINQGEVTSIPVEIRGVLGLQQLYVAAAACTVALALEMDLVAAVEGLKTYTPAPGRMKLIPGFNGSLIIDDTYNSSPIAVESALKTLEKIETTNGGRRIVVLGDMLELGKYSSEAHRDIGKKAAEVADIVIGVGVRSGNIVEGAKSGGVSRKLLQHFKTAEEAGVFLLDTISRGDIILIKGSQKVRMERIVKMLMEHPEDAKKLLVRQEEVWKEK